MPGIRKSGQIRHQVSICKGAFQSQDVLHHKFNGMFFQSAQRAGHKILHIQGIPCSDSKVPGKPFIDADTVYIYSIQSRNKRIGSSPVQVPEFIDKISEYILLFKVCFLKHLHYGRIEKNTFGFKLYNIDFFKIT
ncbi:hypothetical protein ES707_19083 [subsurface metagenome]